MSAGRLISCISCTLFADFDGDGYQSNPCCTGPLDCDDTNPQVYPGAAEVCNGVDDDCDGAVDENAQGTDSDGDGVHNLCDDCVLDFDPAQHDLDGDAQGDVCDLDDGLILVLFRQTAQVEWQEEAGFFSWNVYKGDLDVLKESGTYTQSPGSNPLARRDCDLLDPYVLDPFPPPPGKTAFFLVTGMANGIENSLGQDSQGRERPNTNPCP